MKVKKIVLNTIIIMLMAQIFFFNVNYVYATDTTTSDIDTTSTNPIENPDYYKPTDTTGNNTQFISMGNIIIGTMRALGTVIAVIALMVIGLRYMFGSTAERASYKETMIPYLIGAVMLFTIPNILGIIYDLVKVINL